MATLYFGFFNNYVEGDAHSTYVYVNTREKETVLSMMNDIYEYFYNIVLHCDDPNDYHILEFVYDALKNCGEW